MAKAPLPKVVFSWVVALLIAAFAIYPALKYPIEEYTEDASWFHIYRGVVFSDAMSDGQLFPRWVQPINAGLGGPLFTFYAALGQDQAMLSATARCGSCLQSKREQTRPASSLVSRPSP